MANSLGAIQPQHCARDIIDSSEDRGERAERQVEVDGAPWKAGLTHFCFVKRAVIFEEFRCGSLKTINRLLLITHGKKRRQVISCALAGKEVLGQFCDDLPLLRARVLRFVDKDVTDPEVKLIQDPGGSIVP